MLEDEKQTQETDIKTQTHSAQLRNRLNWVSGHLCVPGARLHDDKQPAGLFHTGGYTEKCVFV